MPNPVASPAAFNAQSARFMKILFNGIVLGGAQNVRWGEHTGVAGYVPEIGSDHKEPNFDTRQVSGSIERLTLNKKKLRDLFAGGDSSKLDIDFRQYQFQMQSVYQGNYSNLDGSASNAAPGDMGGPYTETLNDIMFTDISGSIGGPNELMRESVSFIGTSIGTAGASETALG